MTTWCAPHDTTRAYLGRLVEQLDNRITLYRQRGASDEHIRAMRRDRMAALRALAGIREER